ncbi:Nudix family hydrolase [Thioalkalicoccus limnaeus]|uniref:8-oxo-dGTP diphosphatase n=1 Tax=Thioalkalicoccus limnaeus TaxID=120681 RepID=A0ABV4BB90_9GAMM
MSKPVIEVVAGAIRDDQGRVLIARRPDHAHQGGLWEFPGGKLEPGESPLTGLRRELDEELGIQVLASRPLICIHHDYGDRVVRLDVHRVERYAGRPVGREGQPLAWQHPDDLGARRFPAADRPVLTALRLPDRLLITGPDPLDPVAFVARLERALAGGIRLVQLRAPGLDARAYADLADVAYRRCRDHGATLVLNAPPDLAGSLPGDGLHLSAHWLRKVTSRPAAHPWVGASCHGPDELARAEALDLDYVLLSPVKPTATHPGATPLGWSAFAALIKPVNRPVYALGGLGPNDLAAAWQAGAQGIAAIRGLWSFD